MTDENFNQMFKNIELIKERTAHTLVIVIIIYVQLLVMCIGLALTS